jgi:hypothetical protein
VNPMHMSLTNEQYTPREIVEPSRLTLGAIDFDPASCALANTVVRASRYVSLSAGDRSGLLQSWAGRTFCNPPGGKDDGESATKLWWDHGVNEWRSSRVSAMIWIAFKLDFMQTTQIPIKGRERGPSANDFPVCIPSRRLAYLTPTLPGPTPKRPDRKPTPKQIADHAATGLCTGDSPPHASAIIFLPGHDYFADVARFREAFREIGEVVFDFDRLPSRQKEAA